MAAVSKQVFVATQRWAVTGVKFSTGGAAVAPTTRNDGVMVALVHSVWRGIDCTSEADCWRRISVKHPQLVFSFSTLLVWMEDVKVIKCCERHINATYRQAG